MNTVAIKERKEKEVEKSLIVVDLDGTLLNKDFCTLNQENKRVLQKLQKLGHKICIATGRNYESALPFYKEIGLDTFLITYNGAYVNNPSDGQVASVASISNEIVREILSEEIIQKNLLNCMVDTADRETVSSSDDVYYREIFFNGNPYKKGNVLELLGNKDCLQLVLEFPNDLDLVNRILSTLRKWYKTSVAFYHGDKLKALREGDTILVPDDSKVIIKLRSINADKGKAAELAAGYYNIPLADTMAFGNDINDFDIIRKVGMGIAISNSINDLKAHAHDITQFDNHNAGVAKYLNYFFKLEE